MNTHDPDPTETVPDDAPAEHEPASETERIEEDGEPLGANFA
ncbi:hypothetical protein [uncultured Sphingomonas sp.]